MKYNYLKKKNWSDITRDERTFCMYLFSAFRDDPMAFVEILRNNQSPANGFTNELHVQGIHWELAYEVCFYRDFLKANGKGIKEYAAEIEKMPEIENAGKLIKRTFDLCLFSEHEIIIIEAKAHDPLKRSQFLDFMEDKKHLDGIFNFMDIDAKDHPKIYFVILAASGYFSSPAFTLPNGVAKEFLISRKAANSLISWKQIAEHEYFDNAFEKEKQMLVRADEIYGH